MTYIIGWRTNDKINIISDTVVTTINYNPREGFVGNIESTYTSMGELEIFEDDKCIFEGHQKIYKVSENLIAGICGDIDKCISVLKYLKLRLIKPPQDLNQLSEIILDAINEAVEDNKSINFIFGAKIDSNLNLLIYENGKLFESFYFHSLGTYPDHYKKLIEYSLTGIYLNGGPIEDDLIIVSSILQFTGIHDNILKHHVGGAFIGISISYNGIKWHPDTTVITYHGKFKHPRNVSFLIRGETLATKKYRSHNTMMLNNLLYNDVTEWGNEWINVCTPIFHSLKSEYYIFLPIDHNAIFIIKNVDIENSNLFRMQTNDQHIYNYQISTALNQFLFKEEPETQEENLSYNIILIDAESEKISFSLNLLCNPFK